jgi:hypothetical protein
VTETLAILSHSAQTLPKGVTQGPNTTRRSNCHLHTCGR